MLGKLNKPVRLLQPARMADGAGGAATSWSLLANIWAEIVWRPATPDRAGQRNTYGRRALLKVRRREDITFDHRLLSAVRILYPALAGGLWRRCI